MADFCRDCTAELFGEEFQDKNDMVIHDPDADPQDFYFGICEHCGPGWFDITGKREKANEAG